MKSNIEKAIESLNNARLDLLWHTDIYEPMDEHPGWQDATQQAIENFDASEHVYCEEGDEEFEQATNQFTSLVLDIF